MKKLNKYNVTFDVFVMDTIYEVEAKNKKEAIAEARMKCEYRDAELTVFEIEKVD